MTKADANLQGWSNDRGVIDLLANMMWCLPEDFKHEASREWVELLGQFGLDGKKEILLARLMRSHPELGYEAMPPCGLDRAKSLPEPHDPPSRTRLLITCRGFR